MDLRQYIEARRQQRKILLMAHVIAGYPSVDVNWRMLEMMGYYNTAFSMGHELFCRRLSESGGVGYILPDLPFEEYGDLLEMGKRRGLSPIMLMTPTNTLSRLGEIGSRAHGFVYAVARKGVTGARTELEAETFGFLGSCRDATEVPIALGFGLQKSDDLRHLQGVVEIGSVGSALLESWERGGEREYETFLRELVQGRD